jgi:DNA-binding response OmpR family regulator
MNERILIVDDEPRYVRLMEANLITEGYQVLKAYDGQQAVNAVAEQKPDLVLLDLMMPVLDGFGACERIRGFSDVPIIIITAKGEEQSRVRGLDLGADDYIVKPFRRPWTPGAVELCCAAPRNSENSRSSFNTAV